MVFRDPLTLALIPDDEAPDEMWHWFCDKDCYEAWWQETTYELDELDERMNANIHFHRTQGSKGIYDDGTYRQEVDASWTGQMARHFGIPYKFEHRRCTKK
jgi:hypothetical protein